MYFGACTQVALLALVCATSALIIPRSPNPSPVPHGLLAERDVCATRYVTEKIGDGAPRQIHKHVQLTIPMKCSKNNGCEVSSEESQTYELSWSAEVSGADWISGGFSVAKSVTTGQSNTCLAEKGQTVCVYEAVGYTEYTVRKCEKNLCTPTKKDCDPTYRMSSPNQNDKGSYYYCSSTCRDVGYQYWVKGGGGGCKGKRGDLYGRMLVC